MRKLISTEPFESVTESGKKPKYISLALETWETDNGETQEREKVNGANGVLVVPCTRDGRVIVVHEFQPTEKSIYSFIGGGIGKDESAYQAAERVLALKTGYTTTDLEIVAVLPPDVAYVNRTVTYVVAHGCIKTSEPGAGFSIRLMQPDAFAVKFLSEILKDPLKPHDGPFSAQGLLLVYYRIGWLKFHRNSPTHD